MNNQVRVATTDYDASVFGFDSGLGPIYVWNISSISSIECLLRIIFITNLSFAYRSPSDIVDDSKIFRRPLFTDYTCQNGWGSESRVCWFQKSLKHVWRRVICTSRVRWLSGLYTYTWSGQTVLRRVQRSRRTWRVVAFPTLNYHFFLLHFILANCSGNYTITFVYLSKTISSQKKVSSFCQIL